MTFASEVEEKFLLHFYCSFNFHFFHLQSTQRWGKCTAVVNYKFILPLTHSLEIDVSAMNHREWLINLNAQLTRYSSQVWFQINTKTDWERAYNKEEKHISCYIFLFFSCVICDCLYPENTFLIVGNCFEDYENNNNS